MRDEMDGVRLSAPDHEPLPFVRARDVPLAAKALAPRVTRRRFATTGVLAAALVTAIALTTAVQFGKGVVSPMSEGRSASTTSR